MSRPRIVAGEPVPPPAEPRHARLLFLGLVIAVLAYFAVALYLPAVLMALGELRQALSAAVTS